MNLGYWLEQMKATTAIAAHLAIPVAPKEVYLPLNLKACGQATGWWLWHESSSEDCRRARG